MNENVKGGKMGRAAENAYGRKSEHDKVDLSISI